MFLLNKVVLSLVVASPISALFKPDVNNSKGFKHTRNANLQQLLLQLHILSGDKLANRNLSNNI